MSHAVVYLRRTGGGAALSGATLVHARGQVEWSAVLSSPRTRLGPTPATDNPSDSSTNATPEGPLVRTLTEAQPLAAAAASLASWISKQLATVPGQPELTVCLDLDGSRCSWLSAPGTDETLVAAAISSAQLESQTGEGTNALAWLGAGELGTDFSAQPLAAPAGKSTKAAALAPAQRVVVLATPDLAARLVLDELDKLNITPARVVSLWHVITEVWQSTGPAARAASPAPAASNVVGEVASSAAVAASVVIDPEGRLAWTWSTDRGLVACGSMLLRRVVSTPQSAANTSDSASGTLAVFDEPSSTPDPDAPSLVEITRSDVGRLITEWLAFATQTGVAPSRLVCVGPENLVCAGLDDDLPHAAAVSAVGQTLGRVWPNTAVTAQLEATPIISTLRRAVVQANDLGLPGQRLADKSKGSASRATLVDVSDGRAGLPELSRRPGRASRKVYAWNFVMLAVASALIAALGFKLSSVAGDFKQREIAEKKNLQDLLLEVRDVAPKAKDAFDPASSLRETIREMEQVRREIKPEKPVLVELSRVLNALSELNDTKAELNSLTLGSALAGSLAITVETADTGTVIGQALINQPSGTPWIEWSQGRTRSRIQDGKTTREYSTAGLWKETPRPAQPPRPAATPKPAEAKPAESKPETKPESTPETKPAEGAAAPTPSTTPPPDGGRP